MRFHTIAGICLENSSRSGGSLFTISIVANVVNYYDKYYECKIVLTTRNERGVDTVIYRFFDRFV
jgi:hypothetical protein